MINVSSPNVPANAIGARQSARLTQINSARLETRTIWGAKARRFAFAMSNAGKAMKRSRTGQLKKGSRQSTPGKHARYAPRLIGYGILLAALVFIVIGLMTA
jgi:hypothetical protein